MPELDEEYIKKMMDVLEVYERPFDPDFPVVCFDEKSKQLLEYKRKGSRVKASKPRREDYEYIRHGMVNLFVAVEPKGKKRIVSVTKQRKGKDVALMLEKLVMKTYKSARKIILVLDNLNVHGAGVIKKHLSEERAEAVLERIEWHFTPKHASWLNMAEIEIGALSTQCLKRNCSTMKEMKKHVAIWMKDRNKKDIGINWKFTRKDAATKFSIDSGN